MAADNSSSARRYFNLNGGKFVRRTNNPDEENAKPRILTKGPNAGKQIHEVSYDNMSGKIVNVQFEHDESYGNNTAITFDDGDVFNVKTDSNAGVGFLKMFPNIDITQPVKMTAKVSPVDIKGETVNVTSLFIAQAGAALKWAYTKDNPNGLPATKKVIVNGENVTDKTEMLEFLKANVLKIFPEGTEATVTAKEDTPEANVDENGIPF